MAASLPSRLVRWGRRHVPGRLGGLLCLLAPAALQAQAVVGTITELPSGAPVVGALVRWDSDASAPGGTYLTGVDGRFRLVASGAGVRRMVVERIGLAPVRVGPVMVPATGARTFDVQVEAQPVRLDGLTVETTAGVCSGDPSSAPRVQSLWSEVRKVLRAAEWTGEEAAVRLRIRTHVRELSPGDLTVVTEEAREEDGMARNSVYSLPAEDLDAGGWVRRGGGEIQYFGPDARTLLSDAFLATHCFRLLEVEKPEVGRGLEGLAFEPLPGRALPDIEGVLWVDADSRRLDRLEFSYTDLEQGPGDDLATGRLDFTELPDGRWIVSRWRLRMPVVGVVRGSTRRGTVERRMLTGIRERGGQVLEALGPGYRWSPDTPRHTVSGMVWDSVAARPLPAAEVRLAGRGWMVRSDSAGGFRLEGVPAGRYRLGFHHARLDSLRVDPGWVDVEVGPGDPAPVRLAVPSRTTLTALACGEEAPALVGRVTDPDTGVGIPGAQVEARRPGGNARGATSDEEGWYALCRLEPSDSVHLTARVGPLGTDARVVPVPVEGWRREDLTLLSVAEDDEVGASRFLTGTVVATEDLAPLEGALVTLLDGGGAVVDRALADAGGRFVVARDGAGPHRVRAELLGRAAVEGEVPTGGGRALEIHMPPEAIPVEGLVVEVDARSTRLERAGFYRRQDFFRGHFLPREVLEASVPVHTTDLLYRHSSARPVDMASVTGNTTERRIQFRSATRSGRNLCLPAVFIDGALRRPGHSGGGLPPDYPTLDDLVSPAEIEALEVYESSPPIRFAAGGCGTIVVWRRTGEG